MQVSLAAAVPNDLYVEYIPRPRAVTTRKMAIVDDQAVVPSEPGPGIAWDREAIARPRVL